MEIKKRGTDTLQQMIKANYLITQLIISVRRPHKLYHLAILAVTAGQLFAIV